MLEVLREPLESGEIHISRAARQVTYPAAFQLVAAMNPCPCGYQGIRKRRATARQIKCALSIAPIRTVLNRIDMQVEVPAVEAADLHQAPTGESSATVAERVVRAFERQMARQQC